MSNNALDEKSAGHHLRALDCQFSTHASMRVEAQKSRINRD
jgi:hypothetical protein